MPDAEPALSIQPPKLAFTNMRWHWFRRNQTVPAVALCVRVAEAHKAGHWVVTILGHACRSASPSMRNFLRLGVNGCE